jgi:class 3 adenylate cyclase/CheY-like chemotaxis protein
VSVDDYPLSSSSAPETGYVLIIEHSKLILKELARVLRGRGWQVQTAVTGKEALDLIGARLPDVVLYDPQLPDMEDLEILDRLQRIDSTIPVIILSSTDRLSVVLKAVRRGAFDYVTSTGQDFSMLITAVEKAVTQLRLHKENNRITQLYRRALRELAENLQEVGRQRELLQQAQQRSETLLRNLLPSEIADRLRSDEDRIADGFKNVTVLFADIVDFTGFASRRSPEQLVEFLNEIFSELDRSALAHGVEKIKTIGDSYMAASGLPVPRSDHAVAMARFALDMQERVTKRSAELGAELQLRVGMHSGPVVAGIVGESKFSYDLWGSTVNIASRMESHGEAGAIHISEATAKLLKDDFDIVERGTTQLKGYGEFQTYFLREKAASKS